MPSNYRRIEIRESIHYHDSKSEHDKYYGRKIAAVEMSEERLTLSFEDGIKIAVWDNGQSCCEHRYMTTDDDVASLVDHNLVRIEAKEGPEEETEDDVHEIVFVEIGTDDGFITVVNHNEHNGCYSGFGLTITEVE